MGLSIPTLLLSHQGTALPGLCHPSACTPSGQHPQQWDGGSCWEGAASWWFQLSSPGPRAADRTQRLTHSHEAPLITCLEVTSHRICGDLAKVEGCVVWQRFPEWAQAKQIWERSSGLGNGGAKKSLLVPRSCPDCPQSIS